MADLRLAYLWQVVLPWPPSCSLFDEEGQGYWQVEDWTDSPREGSVKEVLGACGEAHGMQRQECGSLKDVQPAFPLLRRHSAFPESESPLRGSAPLWRIQHVTAGMSTSLRLLVDPRRPAD